MRKILLLIALTVATTGCSDSNNPLITGSSEPSVIMPLRIGNRWLYQARVFDSTVTLINTFYYTTSITRDTTIQGETWFFYDGDSSWLTNRATGLYYLKSDHQGLRFPYPAPQGFFFEDSGKVFVVNDTTVQIPPYVCYSYSQFGVPSNAPFYWYCAPDVGVVRIAQFDPIPNSQQFILTVHELVEFSTSHDL
jgi:hypothetical protein